MKILELWRHMVIVSLILCSVEKPINLKIPIECQKEPLMYMRKAQVLYTF